MENVITLIANPAGPHLRQAPIDRAISALRDAGAMTGDADWLAPGIACDIPCSGITIDRINDAMHRCLGGQPFDVMAQAAAGRRKKLLVADMDSTMIDVECIDELADHVGRRAEVALITERAMRGEIDFAAALRARAAMLRGLDESVFAAIFRERIKPNPGAKVLVGTMRAHGAYTVLVSGGFTEFTSRVGQAIGFDADQANRLIVADGKITGEVAEPVLGAAAKLETLRRLCAERGHGVAAAVAVGDGANDLPMILAAGLGVAYRAKPLVAAAAKARIDHGDLSTLLYLQGYRQAEFVT